MIDRIREIFRSSGEVFGTISALRTANVPYQEVTSSWKGSGSAIVSCRSAKARFSEGFKALLGPSESFQMRELWE